MALCSVGVILEEACRGALPRFRLRQAYGATGIEAVVSKEMRSTRTLGPLRFIT